MGYSLEQKINKPKSCIITVNYFASELLGNITALAEKYGFDLIIVDNSCNADESEALKNIHGIVVTNSDNVGFGAGCHIGIEEAKHHNEYENFLFVNPDITEIDFSKIAEALEAFGRDHNAAYFQPLILDNRGEESILGIRSTSDVRVVLLYTFIKKIFTSLEHYVLHAKELGKNTTNIYIPSGAFFIVKADVFDRIGGFPRDTFLYFEEWLFAARVKKLGMYGYIDPSLRVHHEIGYSTGLQYGAGSAKMLRYRHDAFLTAAAIILSNIVIALAAKGVIWLDYGVRSLILNLKKGKQ